MATVPTSYKPPLLLHEALLPYALLITALSIHTHRRLVAAIFLPLLWTCYYHLLQTTSPSPPAGFVIGAYVVFHAYFSFDLLVLRDPRTEFRRTDSYAVSESNGTAMGGPTKPRSQQQEGEPYPTDSLTHRISWVFDLVTTMRGIGWNWGIKPIPPIRMDEAAALSIFLRRRVVRLLLIWAWLDATVFWMQWVDRDFFLPAGNAYEVHGTPRDAVYAGLFSRSWKSGEGELGMSGFVLHVFRTVLQGALIYAAMNGVYTEIAVLFTTVGWVVGLGEAGGWRRRWLDWRRWPDMFGEWSEGDWGHGLMGWWGKAWHGLFKYVFTSPSRYIINTLDLPPPSLAAMALKFFTPFTMSALLHFCGCYTKSSDGWGAARFFLLQPFGIIIEQAFLSVYRSVMPVRDATSGITRRELERWVPYVWALAWFVATSGSFFDDLRYGGVWALQPVPVSVWKGLVGEGWWAWKKETDVGWRDWWVWDRSVGGWGVRL